MKLFRARYPGRCALTGQNFAPGTMLRPLGRGSYAIAMPSSEELEYEGGYIGTAARVSDVFRTSGGTFYRNKAGRCEDAPCCGCCTI